MALNTPPDRFGGARNPLQPGGVYIAKVVREHGNGTVTVFVKILGSTIGPIKVVNYTPSTVPTVGEQVLVTFLDSMLNDMVVIGRITPREDQLSIADNLIVDSSTSDALVRFTQRGSGDVLRVEDSTNPDSTPLIVKSDGSVGIGLTSPTKKLHVSGDAQITGDFTVGTSTLFFDVSEDSLGIGTTTPAAKLHVTGSTSGELVRITQTGTGAALLVEDSSNPDSTPFIIDASGYVGIGTTSPYTPAGYGTLTLNGSTGSIISSRVDGTETLRFQTTASSTQINTIANIPMLFSTNNTERMRIDSSGRLVINSTTAVVTANSVTPTIQLLGTSAATTSSLFARYAADSNGPSFYFSKSRDTTVGSHSAVSAGDRTGNIYFTGSDGTGFYQSSSISGEAEGTISSAIVPGRLVFYTTSSGGTSTERMRIDSSGNVNIGTALKVDATNNRIGVNVASPAHAIDVIGRIETRAAATQDGVAIVGRSGGTSSYDVTLTPTTLTADRTLTLPNATGTVAILGTIALGTDTTGNYMSGISGTSPVSVSHTPAEGSSATVSLASGYGDTLNPYASKTANYFLASPNGSAGVPTFRAIVAADIPTLNQNTTGTAATVTGAAQSAITSVGTLTSLSSSGQISISRGALGTSSGNSLTFINPNATSSNADSLNLTFNRTSAGSDWQTAAWKFQRIVDVTSMGYISFGAQNWDLGVGSTSYISGSGSTGTITIGMPVGTTTFAGNHSLSANNTYQSAGLPAFGFNAWAGVSSYNFYNASDIRYKQNIKSLPLGIEFLKLLNPIEFTYLYPQFDEDSETPTSITEGSRLRAGLSAQNVKEALNAIGAGDYNFWALANKDDANSFEALDYTGLIAPAIQAIKEMDATITLLKQRIETLENK